MDSEDQPYVFTIVCNFLLVTIFCSGLIANSLVLIVFYKKSGLRTVSNRFVINLMIINTISCMVLLPLFVLDINNTHDDYTSAILCLLTELFSIFCSSIIVYAVLLIAVDQYYAVVDPLRYHTIVDSFKSYVMIMSTWGFSVMLGVLGTIDPFRSSVHSSLFHSCTDDEPSLVLSITNSNDTASDGVHIRRGVSGPSKWSSLYWYIFSSLYLLLVLVIPFVLLNVIYYRICAAASGNSRRTRQNGSSGFSHDESHHEYYSLPLNEHKNIISFTVGDVEKCDSELEKSDNCDTVTKPCLILTRPSPPKYFREDSEKYQNNISERGLKSNSSLPNLEYNKNDEIKLLKPTKLSSVQFSKSTEKMDVDYKKERRHSNTIPINIESLHSIAQRSPSIQSELPTKSSRSSSLHSNSSRNPVSRASSIRSTSSFLVNSLKHRISNASLFRYREEARAARISALVIVMGLVCWFPYFVVYLLHTVANLYQNKLFLIPNYVDYVCVTLLLLSTIISPCLFAFRNRKIKKEIRKMFNSNRNDLNRKSFYNKHFPVNLKNQTIQNILFGIKNKDKTVREKTQLQSNS